jgi:hypothetical protein
MRGFATDSSSGTRALSKYAPIRIVSDKPVRRRP